MTTYSAITSAERAVGAPYTASLAGKMANNHLSVQENDPTAPDVQYAVAAGTVPWPGVTSVSIDQADLAADSVGQSEIKEGTQSESNATASTVLVALTASQHTFYSLRGRRSPYGNPGEADIIGAASSTTSWVNNKLQLGEGGAGDPQYADVYYIGASPPYDLGDGNIPLFGMAVVDGLGNILQTHFCEDPPWAYNGPTNVVPDFYAKDGKIYKIKKLIEIEIPDWRHRLINNPADRAMIMRRLKEDGRVPVEIDQAMKNADKDIVPHPFEGVLDVNGNLIQNYYADKTIVMLDPVSPIFEQLLVIHNDRQAESVCEILHNDYLRIGNSPLKRNAPTGVMPVSLKWKLT